MTNKKKTEDFEIIETEDDDSNYLESAEIMVQCFKKYPNKYFHDNCDNVASVLDMAMLNFWRLTDLANSENEDLRKMAHKIMTLSCKIKNFKEAENLYWD